MESPQPKTLAFSAIPNLAVTPGFKTLHLLGRNEVFCPKSALVRPPNKYRLRLDPCGSSDQYDPCLCPAGPTVVTLQTTMKQKLAAPSSITLSLYPCSVCIPNMEAHYSDTMYRHILATPIICRSNMCHLIKLLMLTKVLFFAQKTRISTGIQFDSKALY